MSHEPFAFQVGRLVETRKETKTMQSTQSCSRHFGRPSTCFTISCVSEGGVDVRVDVSLVTNSILLRLVCLSAMRRRAMFSTAMYTTRVGMAGPVVGSRTSCIHYMLYQVYYMWEATHRDIGIVTASAPCANQSPTFPANCGEEGRY